MLETFLSNDLAFLDVNNIVGTFIQIGGDVRGEQNGFALVTEGQEDIQQLIPGDGV